MKASRRSLALVMLVATMVVWGSTFVITKAAARDIAPMMLATLRFFTAAIVLLPYAWLKGDWRSLPKPLPWGALLGMALTGIATFTIAFNYALVYGSASQGALIYALVPAAVAVAAVLFLRERMSKQRVAGIVLSIIGVVWSRSAASPTARRPSPC
jgi:drug/metabolite transporter (DMT)-like permease